MMRPPAAVGYLHSKRIVHRDLKPANVFLRDASIIKLGDLGYTSHLPSPARSALTT